jgi:hypothetical protein
MSNEPGLGASAFVIVLDLGLLLALSLVWREYGWPYAVALFLAGKSIWHFGIRRRR